MRRTSYLLPISFGPGVIIVARPRMLSLPAFATTTATGILLPLEKSLSKHLELFPDTITEAATEHDPSKLAIYLFELAKIFNTFYTQHSIANAESEEKKLIRLQLANLTALVLNKGMQLLGINVPERM